MTYFSQRGGRLLAPFKRMLHSEGAAKKIRRRSLGIAAVLLLFSLALNTSNSSPVEWQANPYLSAASWAIPDSAPAVQRRAQLAQQEFCKAVYLTRKEPPLHMKVNWKPTAGGGNLAEMEHSPERKTTNFSDDTTLATLVRVDGIQPAEQNSSRPPYLAYVFDSEGDGQHAADFVSRDIINNKQWEAGGVARQIRYLDAFAKERGLPRSEVFFIDIGANIGSFTLAVAAAGFQVIAFEAMSINQFALSMSLCSNLRHGMAQLVTLLPVALSREPAKCEVYSDNINVLDGNVRCDEEGKKDLISRGAIMRQRVDVERLDDVLRDWMPVLKGRIGSLKMDTEGLEPWVVEGATTLFNSTDLRPPFLQVEVSDTMSKSATNVTVAPLLQRFVDWGYQLKLNDDDGFLKPEEVRAPGPTDVLMFWAKEATTRRY